MPRASLTILGLTAAACAGCASPRPEPTPGPIYTTAGIRDLREEQAPSPRSLAGAASLQSRRQVDLGELPYNGLSLPLISPDARFIATQIGPPPGWGALLAEPNAPIAAGPISIHAIEPEASTPVRETQTVPPGVLLGRAANATGFLIEQPRQGSSPRRIGEVDWQTGQINWLTVGQSDCAFATLGPENTLAYSVRAPGEAQWSLAFRSSLGTLHTASVPDASLVFPVVVQSVRGLTVFALAVPDGTGTELSLVAFEPVMDALPPSEAMALAARAPLAASGSLFDAYQCVAGTPAFLDVGEAAPRMLAFSTSTDSIVIAELVPGEPFTLQIHPLVPGTFAADFVEEGAGPGVLACTVADTIYSDLQAMTAAAGGSGAIPALVWSEPGLPRRLDGHKWSLAMLFTRNLNDQGTFRVVLLTQAATESQE